MARKGKEQTYQITVFRPDGSPEHYSGVSPLNLTFSPYLSFNNMNGKRVMVSPRLEWILHEEYE